MFALRHILSFLQQKLHKTPLSKIPDEYSPCISCSCFYSFFLHSLELRFWRQKFLCWEKNVLLHYYTLIKNKVLKLLLQASSSLTNSIFWGQKADVLFRKKIGCAFLVTTLKNSLAARLNNVHRILFKTCLILIIIM